MNHIHKSTRLSSASVRYIGPQMVKVVELSICSCGLTIKRQFVSTNPVKRYTSAAYRLPVNDSI